jgi:hypothetical protein
MYILAALLVGFMVFVFVMVVSTGLVIIKVLGVKGNAFTPINSKGQFYAP